VAKISKKFTRTQMTIRNSSQPRQRFWAVIPPISSGLYENGSGKLINLAKSDTNTPILETTNTTDIGSAVNWKGVPRLWL